MCGFGRKDVDKLDAFGSDVGNAGKVRGEEFRNEMFEGSGINKPFVKLEEDDADSDIGY